MTILKEYNFIKLTKVTWLFSLVLFIISITSISVNKFNFGIDFTGGVIFDINITDKSKQEQIKDKLSLIYKNNIFQTYNDGVIIKISQQDITSKSKDIENITQTIKLIDSEIVFNKVDFVGAQVGDILVKNGIKSLLLSFIGIMLYIWLRFKLHFGISAITALIHDILILFGFISICKIKFDLTTIAAILTVVGYSVNDTVVLFDRIRENLKIYKKEKDIKEIVNISINNNLKRTLYTSISTLFAIFPLVFSTVDSLKGFSAVVMFGIIIGTYSSIFIASLLLTYKYKLLE